MNPLWFLAGVGTGLALPELVSGLRPLATEVGTAATTAYEQLQAFVASRPSAPSRSRPRKKAGAATPGRRGRARQAPRREPAGGSVSRRLENLKVGRLGRTPRLSIPAALVPRP
jgi:hypothetical protein